MTGLRVGYVLGTTSGGTGRHAAMLAAGCLRDGLSVVVFGPEQSRSLFAPDLATSAWSSARATQEPARAGEGPAGAGEDRAGTAQKPAGADGRPSGARAGPAGTCEPAGSGGDPSGARAGSAGTCEPGAAAFERVQIGDRPRPVRDAKAVWRLGRLMRRADLDVVHAHGLRAGALAALACYPAAAGRWPGRRAPALVVTVHNAPPPGARSAAIYRLLERLVARRADAVLCVSADLSARMRRLGARDVELAVGPAPLAAAPRGAADLGAAGRPVVLAVGRLTSQKGFDTLLAAAVLWRDRRPAPVLVIAGEGPLEHELTSRARALAVGARFLGVRHDVPALLAAADVFVLPSRWEGQPLILQEALRAGRPIVATDVGGVPDLTGPSGALLVPAGDPAALAGAVLRVLDDRDLAARLAAAALTRAGQLPSEADAVRAARAVYDKLAATAGPRRCGRPLTLR